MHDCILIFVCLTCNSQLKSVLRYSKLLFNAFPQGSSKHWYLATRKGWYDSRKNALDHSCLLSSSSSYRQWLPSDKIEPLGVSAEYDSAKVAASGASKRSVQQAFQRAKQYQRKVAQSVPVEISSSSSSDSDDDDDDDDDVDSS